jgi:hypothetical protein
MIGRSNTGTTAATTASAGLTPQQTGQLLTKAVGVANDYRIASLGQAIATLNTSLEALKLEAVRLTGKYGANSAQVRAVVSRQQLQTTILQSTTINLQRAQTPVPKVPAGGAAIFGRLVDSTGAGIADLTVAALDQQDAVIARASSDASGAFSLGLTAPRAVLRKADTTQAPTEISYRLRVTDKQQLLRYEDKASAAVGTGRLSYREIVAAGPTAGGTSTPVAAASAGRRPKKQSAARPRRAK